jgi:hypothetical protein
LVIRSKNLFGHAINTAKVTPVGDGNSQIAKGSVKGVYKRHRGYSVTSTHLNTLETDLIVIHLPIITIIYETNLCD